jgi:Fic family protein
MNAADFRCPAAGQVVRTRSGYPVFVPAPPPPTVRYDADLALLLSEADAALGELSALGRYLPSAHLLVGLFARQEAVLSSRIEGSRVGLTDLLLHEIGEALGDTDEVECREVQNYVVALEHGIRRLEGDFPLSNRLVRELHERLMTGAHGMHATPGEFRRSQNWIGAPRSTPATATYVPPPPDRLLDALAAWERFLHVRGTMPVLVQCALIHEHFEAIHPFLDGNGRVGRLLITLFLIEREYLSQPLLYLSAYIHAHRPEYYDLLLRIRTDCAWDAWLRFFLRGVAETSHAARRQATRLLDLRDIYRERLRGKPRTLTLLDELFVNPYVTVARARAALGVTAPTARAALAALSAAGVLEEVGDRSWRKLWLARSILETLGEPAERIGSDPDGDPESAP